MENTCKIDGQIEEVKNLLARTEGSVEFIKNSIKELEAEKSRIIYDSAMKSIIESLKHRFYDIKLVISESTQKRPSFKFTPVNHDRLHKEDMDAIKSAGYEINTLGDYYLWLDKIE